MPAASARLRRQQARRRALRGLKRWARRGVNTSKVKSALGFPDRMITKLEYRTSASWSSTGGATSYYDYRLNSIFDPEVALGGHQPLWTDQFAAVYNKYRVFAVKYVLKIVGNSTGGVPARVVALASGEAPAALPATITAAWEQNRTGNKLIAPGQDTIITMRGKYSLPKLQGETSVEFKGDNGNEALLTANPTNAATLRLMMESTNTTAGEVQYLFDLSIIYFVEFFERLAPGTS